MSRTTNALLLALSLGFLGCANEGLDLEGVKEEEEGEAQLANVDDDEKANSAGRIR